LSLTGPTNVWETREREFQNYAVTPEEFGLTRAPLSALAGGGPQENRVLMEMVLGGGSGPLAEAVALNAAGALLAGGGVQTLLGGVEMALEVLHSGAALLKLHALSEVSQRLAKQ